MSEKKTPKIYMSFRNNQKAIEVPNGLRTVIRKCIAETLRVTDFVGDADVSVTLVDNERIKRINKEFRDKNKVTDVISFPLGAYDEYDVNPENGAYARGYCNFNGEGTRTGDRIRPFSCKGGRLFSHAFNASSSRIRSRGRSRRRKGDA